MFSISHCQSVLLMGEGKLKHNDHETRFSPPAYPNHFFYSTLNGLNNGEKDKQIDKSVI